jgi:hypothetical protein
MSASRYSVMTCIIYLDRDYAQCDMVVDMVFECFWLSIF